MDFAKIYDAANAAGKAAAEAMTPRPMVVGSPTTTFGNDLDPNQPQYYVADGVCGFAWIKFKGNTPWGRWAKKAGVAKSAYPTGLMIWVSAYGQSMQKKEAYAHAFAKVLQTNGITAYADSRMD